MRARDDATQMGNARRRAEARNAVGMWVVAVAAMLALGACGAEGGAPPGGQQLATVQQRIVGGDAEAGFPAVGALMDHGEAFCTGTLVSSRAVVTAAHCLEGASSPAGLSVYFGRDSSAPGDGTTIAVASLHSHPSYDGMNVENDIAVLLLAEAAPISPIALQTAPMTNDWIGRDLIFVGFGVTGADREDAGLKRSVDVPLTEVYETSFRYAAPGRNTCFGDSGGPALVQEDGTVRLVGVTSWGDEACADFGVNTRVDTYPDFLASAMAGSASSGSQTPPSGEAPAGDDFCAAEGWYGDGICDPDCPEPDPDCEGFDPSDDPSQGGGGEDVCALEGWYGDGICDIGCDQPDPDCEGDGGDLPWVDDDPGDAPADEDDFCEAEGWYGDGICDEDCPEPDPDCGDAIPPADSGADDGDDGCFCPCD